MLFIFYAKAPATVACSSILAFSSLGEQSVVQALRVLAHTLRKVWPVFASWLACRSCQKPRPCPQGPQEESCAAQGRWSWSGTRTGRAWFISSFETGFFFTRNRVIQEQIVNSAGWRAACKTTKTNSGTRSVNFCWMQGLLVGVSNWISMFSRTAEKGRKCV